ncbi:hypothetical protein KCP75_01100 [Salmonella enterica subsp. enterica]|nr:hypothetical protein KCP75_01100 [Salmonella enterica subsp. enterica]
MRTARKSRTGIANLAPDGAARASGKPLTGDDFTCGRRFQAVYNSGQFTRSPSLPDWLPLGNIFRCIIALSARGRYLDIRGFFPALRRQFRRLRTRWGWSATASGRGQMRQIHDFFVD